MVKSVPSSRCKHLEIVRKTGWHAKIITVECFTNWWTPSHHQCKENLSNEHLLNSIKPDKWYGVDCYNVYFFASQESQDHAKHK